MVTRVLALCFFGLLGACVHDIEKGLNTTSREISGSKVSHDVDKSLSNTGKEISPPTQQPTPAADAGPTYDL